MDINNNNTLFHRIIYRARQVLEAAQERGLAVMRGMPQVWRRVEELGDGLDVALPQSTFTLIISALLAFAAMKSQGNPGFPFETHSQMAKIPIACFVIYGLLSAAVYLVKLLAPNENPNPRLVARAHIGRIGLMWIVYSTWGIANKIPNKVNVNKDMLRALNVARDLKRDLTGTHFVYNNKCSVASGESWASRGHAYNETRPAGNSIMKCQAGVRSEEDAVKTISSTYRSKPEGPVSAYIKRSLKNGKLDLGSAGDPEKPVGWSGLRGGLGGAAVSSRGYSGGGKWTILVALIDAEVEFDQCVKALLIDAWSVVLSLRRVRGVVVGAFWRGMNETTIRPPRAITSAKVARDLCLVLITGIAITIVAVVLNPWLGCSKKIVAVDGIGDNIVIIHGRAKVGKKSDNGNPILKSRSSGVVGRPFVVGERVRKIHDFTMESAVIHSSVGGSDVDVDPSMWFSTLKLLQCPLKK
ncbi:hypothetical protein Tco_1377954 [Tanacetum coccineum]